MSKRGGRFEVEWITISYRALMRGVIPVLLILVLVIAAAVSSHFSERRQRGRIEMAIQEIEPRLAEARQRNIRRSELQSVEHEVTRATDSLAESNLEDAEEAVRTAGKKLDKILSEAKDRAQLLQVEGDVRVRRVGSPKWETARTGLLLGAGDLVRTGKDSAAQYQNLDGSVATLGSDTMIRIFRAAKDHESGKTDVAVVVNSGQLTISTGEQEPGSRSEVKTPNLSAKLDGNSVLGVGFDETEERSSVHVVEGGAKVTAGDQTLELGTLERIEVTPTGVARSRIPRAPRLTSPQQFKVLLTGELVERGLDLEWESIRDARSYRVELAQTLLFAKLDSLWDAIPASYVHIDDLPIANYYWRVTAIDRAGVESAPSVAGIFRISDAIPEGEPPPLEVKPPQALGEGVWIFEGKTKPAVYLTIDDGTTVHTIKPSPTGTFRQIIHIRQVGVHIATVSARTSSGLETQVRHRLEVVIP